MRLKILPIALLLLVACSKPAGTAASDPAINVTTYGAVGDGTTLNTTAIQAAIDAAASKGGGTVQVPAGKFLTGTIQLKSNVTLHLDKDAVILGSTNAKDYRNVDPFLDGLGVSMGYSLVVAVEAGKVVIEGEGEIDGQGKAVAAAQKPYNIRPFLIRWIKCTDVTVKDVTLRNSGAWGMNLFQCSKFSATGLTIKSRGLANNDGIDIDSCNNVHVENCDIDTGDDAICLKATSTTACHDITATNNKLSTSCNALKLGTESIGDFYNVSLTHCQLKNIGLAGIAVYSVDGAHLHDVTMSDITMENVNGPINVRLGGRLKTFRAGDKPKPTGTIKDVTIKNVTVTGAKQGILVNGIPGHLIQNITLENISVQVPGGGSETDAAIQLPEKEQTYPEVTMFGKVLPTFGVYLRHVDGITLSNIRTTPVKPDARPGMVTIDVKNVTPANFSPATAPAK